MKKKSLFEQWCEIGERDGSIHYVNHEFYSNFLNDDELFECYIKIILMHGAEYLNT